MSAIKMSLFEKAEQFHVFIVWRPLVKLKDKVDVKANVLYERRVDMDENI